MASIRKMCDDTSPEHRGGQRAGDGMSHDRDTILLAMACGWPHPSERGNPHWKYWNGTIPMLCGRVWNPWGRPDHCAMVDEMIWETRSLYLTVHRDSVKEGYWHSHYDGLPETNGYGWGYASLESASRCLAAVEVLKQDQANESE